MKKILFLSLALLSFVACSKPVESGGSKVPTIGAPDLSKTIDVSAVVNSAVTLTATVNSTEARIANYGFCYDTKPNVNIDDSYVAKASNKDSKGTYSYTLENLKVDTDYFVKAYAAYGDQVWYSEESHISTTLSEYVFTEPVQIRARIGAICEGRVPSSFNRPSYTSWGFCLSTSSEPTVDDLKIEASKAVNAVSKDGEFSAFVDDLTPGTEYFVRSYAIVNGETHYGEQRSFSTTQGASITYTLRKEANPTADQADAYERINTCVDSAIFYFHRYCNKTKKLTINYVPDVPTADASSAGNIRFGKHRAYMWVGTAMHEMNHSFGSGTSSQSWALYGEGGWYIGRNANVVIRTFYEDYTRTLQGAATKTQHFWPGGINYDKEVKNDPRGVPPVMMLKMNAMIMEGMMLDGMTQ